MAFAARGDAWPRWQVMEFGEPTRWMLAQQPHDSMRGFIHHGCRHS
jgi:hypothetical protein